MEAEIYRLIRLQHSTSIHRFIGSVPWCWVCWGAAVINRSPYWRRPLGKDNKLGEIQSPKRIRSGLMRGQLPIRSKLLAAGFLFIEERSMAGASGSAYILRLISLWRRK